MRMMRFSYTIVPGKSLCTADGLYTSATTLTRPLNHDEKKLEADVNAFVDSIIKFLPSTESCLEELMSQQLQDEGSHMAYCTEGWPDRFRLPKWDVLSKRCKVNTSSTT